MVSNIANLSVDNGIKCSVIVSNKCGVFAIFNVVTVECLTSRTNISNAHVTPTGGGRSHLRCI